MNLAREAGVVATQSSVCEGGQPSRAIDGNTSGNWGSGSIMHTCPNSGNPWFMVDLGANKELTVNYVLIWNRMDCCSDRIAGADVEILDEDGTTVAASQHIAAPDNSQTFQLDFGGVSGRYLRIERNGDKVMNIAEVEIFGPPPITKSPSMSPTSAPTSSAAPTTLAPTSSPFAFEMSNIKNLAQSATAAASQSSTCHGGGAKRAIDGNTNGNYYSNSVTHTCNDANPWHEVDLGQDNDFTINSISVYNRNDCCTGGLKNSRVEILDADHNVVATQLTGGDVKNVYNLDYDNVVGRYVRFIKGSSGGLTIAEVQVMGWSLYPLSVNLARRSGTVATQSSNCWGGGPNRGKDGNRNGNWGGNSVTHTCGGSIPWWKVDLGADQQFVITSVSVYNRSDGCCQDRNGNSNVEILDVDGNVLASQLIPGGDTSASWAFQFDSVEGGRYVRVIKNVNGELNLAEVEVLGFVQG